MLLLFRGTQIILIYFKEYNKNDCISKTPPEPGLIMPGPLLIAKNNKMLPTKITPRIIHIETCPFLFNFSAINFLLPFSFFSTFPQVRAQEDIFPQYSMKLSKTGRLQSSTQLPLSSKAQLFYPYVISYDFT